MKRDTSIARNIWLQHHEYIPKDVNGKSYEIHHIDGNHENNDINNLLAIPINMHYEIHYLQNDYLACNLIAERINKPTIKGYKLKPLSKETKKKIGDKKRGIILSDEWKQNISKGGKGKKKSFRSDEHRKNMSIAKTGIPNIKLRGRIFSKEALEKMRNSKIGKKYSEETNKKKGRREEQMGEKNPMFGRIFITNGIENKTIKKDDIIPNGWYIGKTNKKQNKL